MKPSPTNLSDELREKIRELLAHADYSNNMADVWSEDAIIDAITAAYAEAIRSAVPQWADEAYYTKHPVVWKPIAPESNAEHYDAGFNQAIDTFTTNLKNQGLLPNGKDGDDNPL